MTSGPYGIEIMGNTLYACDGARIRGYNLTSGSQVFNVNLGATFLNGITSDGANYLYASDYSAKKLYRIHPSDSTFKMIGTTTKSPNGMYFDADSNRVVFVTWGSGALIQQFRISDSTISTIKTTTLSNYRRHHARQSRALVCDSLGQ